MIGQSSSSCIVLLRQCVEVRLALLICNIKQRVLSLMTNHLVTAN